MNDQKQKITTRKPDLMTDKGQRQRTTVADTEKETVAAEGKGGRGARRKPKYFDDLTPEERSLFEEHAREDDDDVPSGSGAHLGGTPGAEAVPRSIGKSPAGGCSGSASGESSRAEPDGAKRRRRRRRRRGGQRPLPEAGQPGGGGDPRRRGMSGSTMRWYLRHLHDGKTPEEAEALARSKSQRSNVNPATGRDHNVPARAQGSGSGGRGPVSTTLSVRRGDSRALPAGTSAQAEKRKSGQITPQEPPRSKRVRGTDVKETGGQQPGSAPHRVEEVRRGYADAVRGIRMAVLPLKYPAEALKPEELTVLQDILMDEVCQGVDYTASFLGIDFRGGMMQVDCHDESSANWLKEHAPKLGGWSGPVLCAKRVEDVPIMHSMTVFLPRCGDRSYEYALSLVRNQNRGLSISAWCVASSKKEKLGDMEGWRLNVFIDDESYKYVRAAGFRLFYRYSTVVMRPYKTADAGSKEAKTPAPPQDKGVVSQAVPVSASEETKMEVDESSEQPCGSRTELAVPGPTSDVPDDGRSMELPSTQELLDGLGDSIDSSAVDGRVEDLSLLEPNL
ncbi:uncharacterized protein LOC125780207 [Bactrocera dorsalis]|uniref:Uncharacterized protein LOC125780207 n=1 Tax=Bactrocera dorsalis TaxID=27457 RepID=A0ABM3K933_BACDO|nr:uncharacterized protein LOC125780207 [Bactrocera dorsalis]XP_049317968.1 uncharacterized protein LOC125780207 [Bactrocera dorsalis]XP_049317969.1 uncharacterized protein LOC125780207 [Bactrocera dorsalis]XP_049317970.1 uncharacterized protein LOC125780207 [Bactrocera dorsalis]XP_049317971.1 uncharacterized protein LOC125780207 [Bactrocera dorsalis]XP_049317972.1 uncharacterized protein LOC125780207 [Bactrocera dorsalis]XP_049317973.1 uncharacterized protein LOC125780207 [Bactrocera dorsali